MSLFRRKLTLMVIPDSHQIAKQVSLPVSLIYFSIGVAVLALIAGLFLAAAFFSGKVDQVELDRLRAENQKLHEKYEQMRWDLAEVDSRYMDLVKKEVAIRTIFDLPEIDSEERQLGIGGPGSQTFDRMSPSEQFAFQTEAEVDRLLRLSEFELEKYSEVETDLQSLKDRLDHTPSIWPTKGWFSRGFGMKHDPFTGYKQMHRGIDIANHTGTAIVAAADGQVKKVGKAGGMGLMVTIDHGFGFVTRYGHLSKSKVKVGQRVSRGDVIALMGSSGYSTGPHLHYEVWRNGQVLNPSKYILNDM